MYVLCNFGCGDREFMKTSIKKPGEAGWYGITQVLADRGRQPLTPSKVATHYQPDLIYAR